MTAAAKLPAQRRQISSRVAGLAAGACLGFLAGGLSALLASRSIWLEMRINTGLLLPLGLVLGALAGLRGRACLARRRLWLWEALLLLAGAGLLGFDWPALQVVPACLLREGCLLPRLSLGQANALLVAGLLAGNALWFAFARRAGSGKI